MPLVRTSRSSSVGQRDVEQFRRHLPVDSLDVLADQPGEAFANFQWPRILLMLHRFSETDEHQPGVLLEPLVPHLEVRRRVDQELLRSRERVGRFHVERGRRHCPRRQDRPRPRTQLVNPGQRVDAGRRSQPGIRMPQDGLQVATDDIRQVANRVVLRLGVIREVGDREAEPAPVTDVVPEEGVISGHGVLSGLEAVRRGTSESDSVITWFSRPWPKETG